MPLDDATRPRPRSRPRVPAPVPTLRAGSGEPMLLIHPFMLTNEVWTDVLPRLAEHFDVCAVTLPGHHGGPSLPRRHVSLDAFADGVERMLDDLGWDTCHVAGNSIGGWLSLELARRGRARTVTAIAPAGGWRKYSAAQMLVGAKFLSLAPLAMVGHLTGDLATRVPGLCRLVLRVVAKDPGAVEQSKAAAFVRSASNCSAFLPYVWSDLRRGGIDDFDGIDVPVQLVLCEDDWLLPPERYARAFLEELPDADVVRLEGVGHVPMYEAPDDVADLIEHHASTRLAGPGTGSAIA